MSKLEIRDLSYTLEILREKEQEKAHRARKAAERKARMEAYHEIEFDSSHSCTIRRMRRRRSSRKRCWPL